MESKKKRFEEEPDGVNREALGKAQAELNLYLKREKELWRQKARYKWFKDGEIKN